MRIPDDRLVSAAQAYITSGDYCMSMKSFAAAACAAVLAAAPLSAQTRGTMEFGAFASAATFEHSLSLNLGYGGGGRVGMFLDRRWALEFEKGEMRASRPDGLKNVNVGILSSRLVSNDFQHGQFTALVGIGAGVSTETNFLHSYGFDGLAGLKLRLSQNSALRFDVVHDVLANNRWKSYTTLRLGMSWMRHPDPLVTR